MDIASYIVAIFGKIGYTIQRNPQKGKADNVYHEYYPEEAWGERRFFNVGAGGFYHKYWNNVDMKSDWYKSMQHTDYIDFNLESLDKLPVDNDYAYIVYSSHTVEHITNNAAQNLFNESYRILKKGGILRITTPDINIEYDAFRRNDRNCFYWIDNYSDSGSWEKIYTMPLNKASIQQIFLEHFASQLSILYPYGSIKLSDEDVDTLFNTMKKEDALDYCIQKCSRDIHRMHPGNHINWWNEAKMTRMLRQAKFSRIYRSGYGQSISPALRDTTNFDNTHPKISLYMEAVKD